MGIQSLLPFLRNSTRDAQISEFENEFVAIDAYCWLHKGIYSCSVDIAMKKPTTKYVTYCMRYIEMLLHFKVKPIMVFDGKKLSSKSDTEKKRREERKNKYKKGIELIRAGKMNEGRKLLGESVDITHELAVNLMKECRKKNIDCIVAPYEADSQLAYLSLCNIVKCVITEDSDLLVYGCKTVMFKMDTSGRGKLTEKSQLYLSLGINPEEFSEDNFRYMCILSGCDYLPSLPSIGPASALKFIKLLNNRNIYEVLPMLPIYLNKLKINVTSEYIEGFKVADNTFKHQIVYDPLRRKEVPLRPVNNDDEVVGERLSEDLAFQLAIGNIDPISMKKMDDFDPDESASGFKILWKTDLIPNATPRQAIFNSSFKSSEPKKRQREGHDSDTVHSVINDLKKHCLSQGIPNSKPSNGKRILRKQETGFIFQPLVFTAKKGDSKPLDDSKLLESRYFFSEKKKEEKKQSTSDRRKDESNEEYLRRLYDECVSEDEDGDGIEQKEKKLCCEKQKSASSCSTCKKCPKCCECDTSKKEMSDSQRFDECLRKIDELKKKQSSSVVRHSLLDEIYRAESGSGRGVKADSSNTIERNDESLKKESSPGLEFNSTALLRNEGLVDDTEESVRRLSFEKENNTEDIIAEVDIEEKTELTDRSPSPVFKVRKESRILSSSCRYGNIPDTAATPTSVYFSASNSRSFQRSNSLVSVGCTPCSRKMTSKSFSSMPSKMGKSNLKNSSVHRTLFQFGFKKERKDESEKKA